VFNETLYRVGAESLERPSVREWLSDWLSGRKGVATHGTMQKYRQVVEGFLAFLGRKADAKLESLIQGVSSASGFASCRGPDAQTVNGLVRKVLNARSLSRSAWEYPVNPVAALPPLRTVKAPKGIFSPEQMDRLVAAAEGDWKACPFWLLPRARGYRTWWSSLAQCGSARGTINFEQSKTGTP
jgi:hypothetical protein